MLSTPGCLHYNYTTNNDCQVIYVGGAIRQVKVPDGLADVITNNGLKYCINFYSPTNVGSISNGVFQTSGSPFSTNTVENPDTSGTTTNQLRITDGTGAVCNYVWKTNGWEMTMPGGLCQKYKTTVWSNSNTVRTVTAQIYTNSGSQLFGLASATYQTNSYGERLIQSTSGSGSTAKTNTLVWTTNGFAQQSTYADGNWKLYVYDTNNLPTNIFSAFMNQATTNNRTLCRLRDLNYSTNVVAGSGDRWVLSPGSPRRKVEYVLGHEVSRAYAVVLPGETREIRCVNPAAAWNDASNLVTITKTYTNGSFQNYTASVLRPDGTMDIFQYNTNSSYRTNIVWSGKPDNSLSNIVDGTKTEKVVGTAGQMISRTTRDIASGIITDQQTHSDYDS